MQEDRTLTRGWKDFTTAHDLQIGDLVIFKHEGDMVFHVTPLVLAVVRFSIHILTSSRKKPTRVMLMTMRLVSLDVETCFFFISGGTEAMSSVSLACVSLAMYLGLV